MSFTGGDHAQRRYPPRFAATAELVNAGAVPGCELPSLINVLARALSMHTFAIAGMSPIHTGGSM